MDIDDDDLLRSPRSPTLNLHLAGFNDHETSLENEHMTGTFTSKLLSASPQPLPPLALFDEPAYDGLTDHSGMYVADFVPSSPHSPHIQFLPSDENETMMIPGLVPAHTRCHPLVLS